MCAQSDPKVESPEIVLRGPRNLSLVADLSAVSLTLRRPTVTLQIELRAALDSTQCFSGTHMITYSYWTLAFGLVLIAILVIGVKFKR